MTIDFTCAKCEGSFEIDADDLIEGTEKLVCPHCDQKAGGALVDDFTAALAELRTQVANLSKKFAVSVTIETDDVEEEVDDADDDDETDEEDDDEGLDFDDDDEDTDDEDDFEDEDVDDDR